MSADLYRNDGSILFSDGYRLKTSNGSNTELICSISSYITGFLQINSTHVWIVLLHSSCIKVVDRTTNQISLVSGVCGTKGSDDGNATTAKFYSPRSLIADKLHPGQLLLTDGGNHALRSIEVRTGNVSTVVQSRPYYPYLSYYPQYMAWYENSLLITARHRIYTVTWNDSNEATVDTLTGSKANGYRDRDFGSAMFDNPYAIMAFMPHMFLVADFGNLRLRLLDMRNGQVHTVCIGGCAEANFNNSSTFSTGPFSLMKTKNAVFVGFQGRISKLSGKSISNLNKSSG